MKTIPGDSMIDSYILDDDGNPIKETDIAKWGRWFQSENRHVASSRIGRITVSTVFLGIDHAILGGPPILYETMIFGDVKYEGYQERYHDRSQSLDGHDKAVALVEGESEREVDNE